MSLVWTLAISAVAVLASFPLTRWLGRAAGWPLAALYLAAAGAFWPAMVDVMGGGTPEWSVAWVPDLGIDLALRADGIGVLFTMIALVIGAVVLVYSTAYLKVGRNLSFYLFMAVFTVSMVGLVLTDDLISLFLFWELTSLASFLLIARSGYSAEGASMRTLLITFLGGLTLLAAVSIIIAATGTTRISEALASEVWSSSPGLTSGVALLVLISAFTKSAQFPFHSWLPDAMAAATPVSAYLHAAAVVKAGIFLLLRFSPAFHDVPVWNISLITVGLLTCALGGWFAWQRTDLKKLMAYSTVSQLGLIVATIGVGTELALTAATLHIIAHALFKSGLFMMVGVIDHSTGTRDVRRLPQLRTAMPLVFWTTVLGAASMAGVPPMLGFVSKEMVLEALGESPGAAWVGWAAFVAAALAAVLTFAYSAKLVWSGFVDGRGQERWPEDRPLHATPPVLGVSAALPILAGLPLAIVVGVLDTPVGRAVEAALPHTSPEPHLVLWHGVNAALIASLLVFAVGAVIVARRRTLFPAVEATTPGWDGADVLEWLTVRVARAGQALALLVRADNPTRHVAPIVGSVGFILGVGSLLLLSGGHLMPQHPGLTQAIDVVVLAVMVLGVYGVCRSRSRLAAAVSLSAVGVAMTVQIFGLGGPDVGLTQLLVEALSILMIMLVLQKLPQTFRREPRYGQRAALGLAVTVGVSVGLGVWALTGRRERSEVADYFLTEGPDITGGYNVVNTILVEFRAFDTLGELTVLGMAGVSVVAILSTLGRRYLDPPREEDRNYVPPPRIPLRGAGTAAYRAIEESWGNAIPMQLLVRVTTPLLVIISAIVFWRGHNSPGGGFIAALIGAAVVALMYLSAARDRTIGPAAAPRLLIGGGVAIAVLTGVWGLLGAGSFLQPIAGEVLGIKLTTSLIFDIGVYAAVLGLVMAAFNLLGAPNEPEPAHVTGTSERAEDMAAGQSSDDQHGRPRIRRGSTYLADGMPPQGVETPDVEVQDVATPAGGDDR